MQVSCEASNRPVAEMCAFHRDVLDTLRRADVPALVGGGYAMAWHTSIQRYIKDLDVFIRRKDCGRALDVLAAAGYRTEIVFKHWLGKVHTGKDFVDVIFSSGNGLAEVTDAWFEHAVEAEVLDRHVQVCAAEEMIWSKSFVMERERYDGADVAHILRARGQFLNWGRLLDYFGPHWRVLFSHLILFDYIYPGESSPIPAEILRQLMGRLENDKKGDPGSTRLCQGPLLSRAQYLVDIEEWGYEDARLLPKGNLSPAELQEWTAAIPQSGKEFSE